MLANGNIIFFFVSSSASVYHALHMEVADQQSNENIILNTLGMNTLNETREKK